MDLASVVGNQAGATPPSAERLRRMSSPTSAAVGKAAGTGSAASARDGQFMAARAAQEQRAAATLQRIEVLADSAAAEESLSGSVPQQRRAGHVFQMLGGVWTDARVTDQMKRVKVKPYSAAYFKLVEALPEIRELLSVGEKVVVAGRLVAIEVTDSGVETMSEREIESVRSNW
jgi:hypothetical protein